jgi:hypothetical protein
MMGVCIIAAGQPGIGFAQLDSNQRACSGDVILFTGYSHGARLSFVGLVHWSVWACVGLSNPKPAGDLCRNSLHPDFSGGMQKERKI